jgi:BASS family bile acid:Na+ symporter
MHPADVVGAVLAASIFIGVLALGMGVGRSELFEILRRPSRLARSLLAMNVLGPIVTILVCKMFSLHPAVIVALVTLSIAPVGTLFAQGMLGLVASGHGAYAHGVFFVSTLLSVALTPLAVEAIDLIYGEAVHVDPWAVAEVAVGSLLVPLGFGVAVGRWWPTAKRWIPGMQKASGIILLICLAAFVVIGWSKIGDVLRGRDITLVALALITVLSLAVGHVLGGPDEDDRTVLAFATASRHPGVAIVVANLTDQPLAPIGVLLAVVIAEIAVIPYKRWRKRLHVAGGPGVPSV